MKKAVWLFFLPLLFAAAPAHAVYTQDRMHRFEAALRAASMIPIDGDIDNTVNLEGAVNYGVWESLALGVSAGWGSTSFETSTGPAASRIQGGDVTIVPVFFDFIFRSRDRSHPYSFYGILGLGGLFTSLDEDGAVAASGLHAEAKDDFALKLGFGLDWFANENWIYNFELSHVFTGANILVTDATGNKIDDRELDYWYIGGGVKYLFS
ncbi:MAG TPA: hypothetical protein VL404_09480 [Candidatus Eisenbacteria bacterium]|jgi:hypothetical protein|nr:hypothetical protein [Candidatus Eisenbacteria bacterium]